jgi:hypothetical protein
VSALPTSQWEASRGPHRASQVTAKLVVEVAIPLEVCTVIGPVVAAAGTFTTIWVTQPSWDGKRADRHWDDSRCSEVAVFGMS